MPSIKSMSRKQATVRSTSRSKKHSKHIRSGEKQGDETLYCENCGISFIWTVEEQHAAQSSLMPRLASGEPPLHCPGCRQLLPSDGRERGMVKWYHRQKGYGFLTRHNKEDLYIHRSALRNAILRPGDLVEFSLGENRQGAVATAVEVLAQEGD